MAAGGDDGSSAGGASLSDVIAISALALVEQMQKVSNEAAASKATGTAAATAIDGISQTKLLTGYTHTHGYTHTYISINCLNTFQIVQLN